MSVSTENFVKTVYKFELEGYQDTRPGSIAKALGITCAATTDMARKLAEKGLIDYQKYHALKLTEEGNKMALDVIRKHRLWETFLYRTLDLSLHEIHREAELLEHQTSDFLAEKLSVFLGNPAIDPHGDPIPDLNGIITHTEEGIALPDAKPGKYYEISRLSGSDKEFFDFCYSNNITVGSSFKVIMQYRTNGMTEIEINDIRLLLNSMISSTIYAKEKSL